MDIVTTLLIILSTLFLYVIVCNRKKTNSRAPPSLPRLPFFGSAPWIFRTGRHLAQITSDLVAQYGKLYSFWLGSKQMVVISDPRLIKEAFNLEQVAGRVNSKFGREIAAFGKSLGIIKPDPTQEWKEQRRFILRTLKDFGFGQSSSEKSIKEEASYLIDYFRENARTNQDFQIYGCFNVFVANVIWQIVAGTRCYENSEESQLLSLMEELFIGGSGTVGLFLGNSEIFQKIFNSRIQKRKKLFNSMHDLMMKVIDKNDKMLDEKAPRDLIDKYLVEVRSGTPGFTKQQLVVHLEDLFAAGSETTSSTLRWTVVFLLLHPQVQESCYREIFEFKGDNSPDLCDMEKLPYCQATILEIQRLGTIALGSLIHKTLAPVDIGNYHIEADTLVFANFYHTQRDPALWKEPTRFWPERFLTEDGTRVRNLEHFTPFSIGRRVCLGESLAKAELWLFFTSLVQNVEFSYPVDQPIPGIDACDIGITRIPKPFHCRVRMRENCL